MMEESNDRLNRLLEIATVWIDNGQKSISGVNKAAAQMGKGGLAGKGLQKTR